MNSAVKLVVTTKALDDDQRIIEGWATRNEEDRVGDVVLPRGAVYRLPLPFLLDHDHNKSVGHVDRVEVTEKGIRFWAHIKKISEPGEVQRMCDDAWQLVKNGLRQHVSIGFRILDAEPVQNSRGLTIKKWEWLELSAVTVPALASATITGVKSIGDVCVSISPQLATENNIQAVKSHVYVPHRDIVKDFESARRCLPGSQVSPERSFKIGEHWHFYDNDGALLGVVPEPPAKPEKTLKTPVPMKAERAIDDAPIRGRQLVDFSKAVGGAVRTVAARLEKRISELEAVVNAQQAKIDALNSGSMKFAGEFQEVLDYRRGTVVKHAGDLFCATRDIASGKSIPGRQGGGWTKMN